MLTPAATRRYYAIRAYGFHGYPFPKFLDSYLTLDLARRDAMLLVKDGWRFAEVLRDEPKKPGYFYIERSIVESHGEA